MYVGGAIKSGAKGSCLEKKLDPRKHVKVSGGSEHFLEEVHDALELIRYMSRTQRYTELESFVTVSLYLRDCHSRMICSDLRQLS